jgi:hypothetical protein
MVWTAGLVLLVCTNSCTDPPVPPSCSVTPPCGLDQSQAWAGGDSPPGRLQAVPTVKGPACPGVGWHMPACACTGLPACMNASQA